MSWVIGRLCRNAGFIPKALVVGMRSACEVATKLRWQLDLQSPLHGVPFPPSTHSSFCYVAACSETCVSCIPCTVQLCVGSVRILPVERRRNLECCCSGGGCGLQAKSTSHSLDPCDMREGASDKNRVLERCGRHCFLQSPQHCLSGGSCLRSCRGNSTSCTGPCGLGNAVELRPESCPSVHMLFFIASHKRHRRRWEVHGRFKGITCHE